MKTTLEGVIKNGENYILTILGKEGSIKYGQLFDGTLSRAEDIALAIGLDSDEVLVVDIVIQVSIWQLAIYGICSTYGVEGMRSYLEADCEITLTRHGWLLAAR